MEQQTRVSLVGQWLKDRCQKKGWSLREAAANTGLSHVTIADIMKGVHPSAESIRKLSVAFGGDGLRKLALEDELLTLAGYRTKRTEGELSESVGRLMDSLSKLNESQIKIIGRFADFLGEMEGK